MYNGAIRAFAVSGSNKMVEERQGSPETPAASQTWKGLGKGAAKDPAPRNPNVLHLYYSVLQANNQ